MQKNDKISLLSAIFININIMIGAGLFINTTNLARMVGGAGFLSYALLALLLYPLIASIAMLVHMYPTGGFYTYAKQLHPLAGFIAAWSYFTAKLASSMLLIHASILLLQQIIPLINLIDIYILDVMILSLFIGLNVCNLQTNTAIQKMFLSLKLIPIIFVIVTGLYLFSAPNYAPTVIVWSQFIDTLPFVLFAVIGFEATTSLSNKIKNPQKNGPLAIYISYACVILISIAYQFFFYGSVGQELQQAPTFLQAFPLLLHKLGSYVTGWQTICNIAIASSALGGSYGILFSNGWNLHTLAQNNHIVNSSLFLKENKNGIPYWCVLAEGLICLIYLITTGGSQIPLQQIAAFGCTIAYTISIMSLLAQVIHTNSTYGIAISLLGISNCLIFFASCIHSFIHKGYTSIFIFSCFILIGCIMYVIQRHKQLPQHQSLT